MAGEQSDATSGEGMSDSAGTDGVTETEGLGDAGVKALEAWKKRAREAEKLVRELEPKAARLSELEDASKSETEKLAGQLAELRAERDLANVAAWRAEMVAQYGLPVEAADLLTGSDRDGIEASAKLLDGLRGSFVKSAAGSPDVFAGRTSDKKLSNGPRDAWASFIEGL